MRFAKSCSILLIVAIIASMCGCMIKNIDEEAYSDAIISYLKEKYNADFEVNELYQEFEGNTGMKVRALCSQTGSSELFSVYCYFDSSMSAEKIDIDGKEYSIVDSYAEVLCQNALVAEIDLLTSESCLVKCKVSFNSAQPSREDLLAGLASCLQNQKLDPYIKIYILTDKHFSVEEIQAATESLIVDHAPCTGYIYIAYFDEFDTNKILEIYKENQNDFGNYLSNTDFADRVDFILYDKDAGLQKKQTIKK